MSGIPLPPNIAKLVGRKAKTEFPLLRYWLIDLPFVLVGKSWVGKDSLTSSTDKKEHDRITIAAKIIEDDFRENPP